MFCDIIFTFEKLVRQLDSKNKVIMLISGKYYNERCLIKQKCFWSSNTLAYLLKQSFEKTVLKIIGPGDKSRKMFCDIIFTFEKLVRQLDSKIKAIQLTSDIYYNEIYLIKQKSFWTSNILAYLLMLSIEKTVLKILAQVMSLVKCFAT
jgi:hypothetical protein